MISELQNLEQLAREIDAQREWWRFPAEDVVQGFMGTGPVFIVGDQPSRSEWPASHPNRRAFYGALRRMKLQHAHLTDLYKKRGSCGELRRGLPSDFGDHVAFFRREIDLLRPTRIVALGWLAYRLLRAHAEDVCPHVCRIWHFAYVVRYGKGALYDANIRRALDSE